MSLKGIAQRLCQVFNYMLIEGLHFRRFIGHKTPKWLRIKCINSLWLNYYYYGCSKLYKKIRCLNTWKTFFEKTDIKLLLHWFSFVNQRKFEHYPKNNINKEIYECFKRKNRKRFFEVPYLQSGPKNTFSFFNHIKHLTFKS